MAKTLKFPENFYWGSATASYQVEGGIENNDWAEASRAGRVPPAGIACNHYNLYEDDFDLAKSLGHNAHRISIEWARIEPEEGKFNLEEIEHYKKVLIALKTRGIKPFVTIWHFTLPLWFFKKGGFENKNAPETFARYAKFVVSHLSDYCTSWATMNEPMVYAWGGYLSRDWPPFKLSPIKYLKVVNNLIKSHNLAYKKIKELDISLDVSFVSNVIYYTSNKSPWNALTKVFVRWFYNHRFFKKTKHSTDSININYYFSHRFGGSKEYSQSDMGWNLVPEGIYHVLKEFIPYGKPVYVTEAGLSDEKDIYRAGYIKRLVFWMHKAIDDGVDLRGYMYWSLLDNYEWKHGYRGRFGLISFDEKTQERKIRESAFVYKKICEDNALILE